MDLPPIDEGEEQDPDYVPNEENDDPQEDPLRPEDQAAAQRELDDLEAQPDDEAIAEFQAFLDDYDRNRAASLISRFFRRVNMSTGTGTTGTAGPQPVKINPYEEPIDLGERVGIALAQRVRAPLAITFDGKGTSLHTLLQQIQLRCDEHRIGIFNIPDSVTATTVNDMLTDYGSITQASIDAAAAVRAPYIKLGYVPVRDVGTAPDVIAGIPDDDDRNKMGKQVIDATLIYSCLVSSLTTGYYQRILSKLPSFKQDAVLLLDYMIKDTHSTNSLATRDHKMALQDVTFKKHGYNVDRVHLYIETNVQSIKNNGQSYDDEDVMLCLFKAYKTFENVKWLQHVQFLESQWATAKLTTSKELMEQAKSFSVVMTRNKEWKAATAADTTALTTERAPRNPRGGGRGRGGGGQDVGTFKARHATWKFDRSKSTGTKYTHNGKTYNWCNGPGHLGIPMWVLHEPGTCTGQSNNTTNRGTANSTERQQRNKNNANTATSGGGSKPTKAEIAAILDKHSGSFGDDFSAVVDELVKTYAK